MALLGPPFALGSAKILLSDRVALRFDNRMIFIATMWRKRELLWSEVLELGTATVSTYALYGLVKTGSSTSLSIITKKSLFGSQKLEVSPSFLELGSGGFPTLVEQLERAKAGALLGVETAPTAKSVSQNRSRDALEGAPRSDDFDPDAALARYMARRDQTADIPAHAPSRPAFGRKAA